MLSEIEIIAQFTDAMCDEGIGPAPYETISATGKLERYDVAGDKRKSGNGWYLLHADRFPNGTFGCNKRYGTDHNFTWKPEHQSAPMSADERRDLERDMKARQAARDEKTREQREAKAELAASIWNDAKPSDGSHGYLTGKGIKASGTRIGDFPVFDKDTGEILRTYRGALLIQIRDFDKRTHSLQAIPARPGEDGKFSKLYLTGGAKRGNFFPIGQPKKNPSGQFVFIVVEGFATGCSVHEATGHAVVVAFDSANLRPVCEAIRAKFPDAVILIAADNDRWTVTPIENPGVHHARKAAHAVSGLIAIPEFDDLDGRPTDFNDLHAREGAGAVEAWINAALYPADDAHERHDDTHDAHAVEHGDAGDVLAQQSTKAKPRIAHDHADAAACEVEEDGGFSILGYDRNEYFIFVHGKKQILNCTRGSFSISGLLEIAELNFWERHFPSKQGINANAAANFVIQTAHRRGIYDRARVRAGGAWMDAGRHVFHHGDFLSVDGVKTDVTRIESHYVYEQTLPLPPPSDTTLSDAEGKRLFDIAKMFRWQRDSSAALLAGWTFLSPICGALKWRPHIWLTGPAGNGKSTIMQRYVYALLGKHGCRYAQGNSTESGVRQALGSTSVPVLLDEAEKNSERESQRVENMLSLIRQSSSESDAQTLKGTISGDGMAFYVRSMFCLASIYVGLDKKADIDRLAVLALKTSRGDTEAAPNWVKVKDQLHWLERDTDLRGRMLRRAIDMMPMVLQNIEVFTKVAAKKFGSQRDGDQYGTLIGGCWSLMKPDVATEDQARAFIDSFDWTEHAEQTDSDDSQNALGELTGSFIQVLGIKYTVHDLIKRTLGEEVEGSSLTGALAREELRRHGIRIIGNALALSNSSSAIKKMLAGTPFATDPRSAFGRLPGATNFGGKKLRFNGTPDRVTTLPLGLIGFGGACVTSESELF
jgi:putative DNA primase/helicase